MAPKRLRSSEQHAVRSAAPNSSPVIAARTIDMPAYVAECAQSNLMSETKPNILSLAATKTSRNLGKHS
jgi:hypothetical protein